MFAAARNVLPKKVMFATTKCGEFEMFMAYDLILCRKEMLAGDVPVGGFTDSTLVSLSYAHSVGTSIKFAFPSKK
jgi:hypothetical protein